MGSLVSCAGSEPALSTLMRYPCSSRENPPAPPPVISPLPLICELMLAR